MTFNPTRVPVGGTVRSRFQPSRRWKVVPDGTWPPAEHVWVSDLGTAAIRDPGRHVDTTQIVDAPRPWRARPPQHRKPGPPNAPLGHRTFLDVWSGNADTDRYWRDIADAMGYPGETEFGNQ